VQVTDERTDPIRGLLLRVADLVELSSNLLEIALVEHLPGDVDL
jgi:hypothetical protein